MSVKQVSSSLSVTTNRNVVRSENFPVTAVPPTLETLSKNSKQTFPPENPHHIDDSRFLFSSVYEKIVHRFFLLHFVVICTVYTRHPHFILGSESSARMIRTMKCPHFTQIMDLFIHKLLISSELPVYTKTTKDKKKKKVKCLRKILDFMNCKCSAVAAVISSCGFGRREFIWHHCQYDELFFFFFSSSSPSSTRVRNLFFLLTYDAHLQPAPKHSR